MPKLLGELLQERQEPFVLEAYLLEKGCLRKFKPLKKRLYASQKILKSVVGQLVAANSRNKVKNLGKNGAGENAAAKVRQCEDRKARQSTKRGQVLVNNEACAEGVVIKWGAAAAAAEDGKQLSPVSVLQETESEEGSPVNHRKKQNFKAPTQRESTTSVLTCQHKSNQQTQCSTQELQEMECPINKRCVMRTQQVLIGCVREVIECDRGREKGGILGGDDVWKLVCEKAWQWSRELIDGNDILHLVHHDFLDGDKSGDSDDQWRMVVSMEIGDAILGDFIGEVIASFASMV